MLPIPKKGFRRSVKKHNVNLDICCDWIESCALFSDGYVSGPDIVDVLRENEFYPEQDFAWELVNDAFSRLRFRAQLLGEGYPLRPVRRALLKQKDEWPAHPAYSFCLILSLTECYPEWSGRFGNDFTEQGELFESLTAESVLASLAGWDVHKTGWTRTKTNQLSGIVRQVAETLGETTGEIARWTTDRAKEAGLDLLCFRPFPDGRVGVPVYLCQCASGSDWESKLKTPDLRIWEKIVVFAASPKKAFSMPFTLSDKEFVRHTNIVDGLLLDRQRLLAPGKLARDWLSDELSEQLVKWLDPRIQALPQLER